MSDIKQFADTQTVTLKQNSSPNEFFYEFNKLTEKEETYGLKNVVEEMWNRWLFRRKNFPKECWVML